jgi:hypothetical protein
MGFGFPAIGFFSNPLMNQKPHIIKRGSTCSGILSATARQNLTGGDQLAPEFLPYFLSFRGAISAEMTDTD